MTQDSNIFILLKFVFAVLGSVGKKTGLVVKNYLHNDSLWTGFLQHVLQSYLLRLTLQQKFRGNHPTHHKDTARCTVEGRKESFKVVLAVDEEFARACIAKGSEGVKSVQRHIARFLTGASQGEQQVNEIFDWTCFQRKLTIVCEESQS